MRGPALLEALYADIGLEDPKTAKEATNSQAE
jgi:hypothetical protein